MSKPDELYIGLMSGTSIDGIDVALVQFVESQPTLLHFYNHPINAELKTQLAEISSPLVKRGSDSKNRVEQLAKLDNMMGQVFAEAVIQLLRIHHIDPSNIIAIGSHGQTVRHRPNNAQPFTLQIGDPSIIAEKTQITTIADFRRMDVAAGGQGAPLAPAFHNGVLRSNQEDRIILNLGGIANITYLAKDKNTRVLGFDTGPANTLLDAWFKKHHPESKDDFDRNSQLAQQGKVNSPLLIKLLDDPYFSQDYPKSTGREYFSLDWLENNIQCVEQSLSNPKIKIEDVQRTLLELTLKSITDAINGLSIDHYQVFVCGGGMHNHYLMKLLSDKLKTRVQKTNDLSVDGDYLEAMTFAWLAKRRIEKLPGNLPSVTGASKEKILGAIYLP